ncbi:MAG TPA: 3-dehydroquinate synthase [Azospirillum sp.]|nr:3-dehydroquinate synthase [Azospirillum sp.]
MLRENVRKAQFSDGVLLQRFAVPFEYAVHFTRGLFDPENPVLRHAIARREPARRHRFVVLVDSGVVGMRPDLPAAVATYADRHADALDLAAPVRVLDGGEALKDDHDAVAGLQAWFQQFGLDRQSAVLLVGGGSLLDMGGYAAATTHRGLRTVRVPTTVLGQNDSGVGVKTAVNAFGAKNFIGTFTPPFAVINDYDFIEMLPARDRIAGLPEAVKVAAIRDAAFFGWLEANAAALAAFEPAAMQIMIRRSAELHMRHIAIGGDPFEFGSARPLDFGHWAAHKLESLTRYALRHGEAVAIGLALDTCYSVLAGLLDSEALTRMAVLLERLGLRLWNDALEIRAEDGRRAVLKGLDEFREHLGGELTVTMLEGIGRGVEINVVDPALVNAAIDRLKDRDARRCA